MTQEIAAVATPPADLVGRDIFEKTIADLQTRIGELASKSAIDELHKKIGELVGAVEKLDQSFKAQLDDVERRIDDEEKARKTAIDGVSAQIDRIGQKTDERLSTIDDRLDRDLGTIKQGLEHITGKLESFQSVIDSNRELYKQQQSEIERQRGTVSELRKNVANLGGEQRATNERVASLTTSTTERITHLNSALFGGVDDRKSLIGMIEELSSAVRNNTQRTDAQMLALQTRINENAQSLGVIREELETAKRRRAEQIEAVKGLIGKAAKNRILWGVLGTSAAGLLAASFPNEAAAILQIIQMMLGGQ